MTERDQVVEILRKAIAPPFKAVMGRGDGVVVVDGRPGYIWCRKLGKTEMLMEAYNRGAPAIEDVIVLVQESRIEGVKGYEVIGVASSTSPGNYYPEVPPHGWTHEWRPGLGRDRVTVYPRAWGYLRAEPIPTGSMNVWVTPGWYYYDDYLRWYVGGYSPAFYPPPSGTWNQLLSFEPLDESLHITNGSIVGYGLRSSIPTPSGCTYPIAAIESTGTFASVTENMIEDVRLFMDPIEDCDGNGGLVDHTHATDNGGQLDWDIIWLDGIHDHSGGGEGGQLDWDDIWSDDIHDHSAPGEGGQIDVPDLTDSLGQLLTGAENTDLTDGGLTVLHQHAAGATASVLITLTNRSGAQRVSGDVVVTDPNNDESFIGTAVEGYVSKVLVVAETIASMATGTLWERGGPFTTKVVGVVSRNDGLRTSGTAYFAETAASPTGTGVFAIALTVQGEPAGTVEALFLDELGAPGVASHNILDGSVHPDSVADAVTRGSIIVGNATPKWDELLLGAVNRALLSNGADALWAIITAAIVANTPAGGIAATNVQAAINELDTEKRAIADGLVFVRADKDSDGDYDPLTSVAWDGDAYAAGNGTINWNTVFGVPAAAKAVYVRVSFKDETPDVALKWKAKVTATNWVGGGRTQVANIFIDLHMVIPIAADGTSYYDISGELDAVWILVGGWYI